MFWIRQVLVKAFPGVRIVPSGMVISSTNRAFSHICVAVGGCVGEMVAGRGTVGAMAVEAVVGDGVAPVTVAAFRVSADWVNCAATVCAAAV